MSIVFSRRQTISINSEDSTTRLALFSLVIPDPGSLKLGAEWQLKDLTLQFREITVAERVCVIGASIDEYCEATGQVSHYAGEVFGSPEGEPMSWLCASPSDSMQLRLVGMCESDLREMAAAVHEGAPISWQYDSIRSDQSNCLHLVVNRLGLEADA